MKIIDLKNQYVSQIISYDDFKELILFIKNKSNINFLLNEELNKKELKKFLKIINEISNTNKPLSYVTKSKFFYKTEFYINNNVLIPRFETELLVEEALKYSLHNKNVLDLCCGSGCIGITLKKEVPEINLYLADISKKALKVCKKNLKLNSIIGNIYHSNFLDFVFKKNLKFDFILINPPYISKNDLNVAKSVKNFEPHTALYAKDEGLFFYKLLFINLEKLFLLNKSTIIICEFGFEQKKQIEEIFKSKRVKYNIEFKKDFSNNWRYFILKCGENNG